MTRLKRLSAALLGTAVILGAGGAAYAAAPPSARPLNTASATALGHPTHAMQLAQANKSEREDHDNGKSDRGEREDHDGKSGGADHEDDGNGKTGGAQQEGEHEGQF